MTVAPNGYLGQAFAYKARPPQPDKEKKSSPIFFYQKGSIKSPHFSFVSKAPFALSVSKVRILFILYIKIGKGDGGTVVDKTAYQRLIGKLIYLNHTRPDVSFAVNLMSQFMSEPYDIHIWAAHRILTYLKYMIGQGLLFTREGGLFVESTNFDWAGSVVDRRSTLGYCTFLGVSLITWSKKQKEVSLSNAEAEFRALKGDFFKCRWLKHLLENLRLFTF